jgi:hypothetical protein
MRWSAIAGELISPPGHFLEPRFSHWRMSFSENRRPLFRDMS